MREDDLDDDGMAMNIMSVVMSGHWWRLITLMRSGLGHGLYGL